MKAACEKWEAIYNTMLEVRELVSYLPVSTNRESWEVVSCTFLDNKCLQKPYCVWQILSISASIVMFHLV